MGKAARLRERRAAEEAPKLIVVEEPTATPAPGPEPTLAPTTREPDDASCLVVGCTNLALERHEGPMGVVWLCGSCGRIARANLAAEAAKEALAEEIVALHQPAMEHYARARKRIYG